MLHISNIQPVLPQYEESPEHEESSDDSISSDVIQIPIPAYTNRWHRYRHRYRMPEPMINPVSSVPSTSRGIRKHHGDFRFEAARLWSFRNWLVPLVDPASLAAAGFYYTGKMDRVKCFVCRVVVSHWLEGRTPMQVHEIWSPECRFVRNEDCGNVPIGTHPDEIQPTERRNGNILCRYGLEYSQSFDFNDHRFVTDAEDPTAYDLSRLGLKKVKKPKHLDYITYQSRLNSFSTFTDTSMNKELLADAGFYYNERDRMSICYHCGLGVVSWSPGENPWDRHAIWSSSCCYLITVRGHQFVNDLRQQNIYENYEEEPIVDDDTRSDSEEETNEMTLVEKFGYKLTNERYVVKSNRVLERKRAIGCSGYSGIISHDFGRRSYTFISVEIY
ncbi:baculoviral IAP repeat-containing protein 7-B-like [Bombus fervidus]|uniref:baculoviral IAP repeat-containing protein 7-B-like n=1 Tax=Bombus fervidus TaxID=203811 RepID=UPI003AB6D12E